MMNVLRYLAHMVLGDYALYRIYQLNLPAGVHNSRSQNVEYKHILDVGSLDLAEDPAIRQLAGYAGEDAHGFAALMEGRPVSVCWFWSGKRYQNRNFWPLKQQESKLVQIVTDTSCRGRGLAPVLLCYAAREMNALGFKRLYARIWRSNYASVAAFEKAGWRYIAFVAEVYPLGVKRPIRFVRRRKI